MKNKIKFFLVLTCLLALTACSQSELTAPCPGYGQGCVKKPINSWNYPT